MTCMIEAPIEISTYEPRELPGILTALGDRTWASPQIAEAAQHGLLWQTALAQGLGHLPYFLEASLAGRTVGVLPLAFVQSPLFGRFLVSLPYVNSAGVAAADEQAAHELLNAATSLADRLNVRYLEVRQEQPLTHSSLQHKNDSKVLMRLALPSSSEQLWNSFKSKLRSQIRSGERHAFAVTWGSHECLDSFYDVFSRNMRDLGTPVYSRRFFDAILTQFAGRAELCVLKLERQAVAGALLIHGSHASEVPSASSLRQFNSTNANMVMYWHLLQRSIERGQVAFDFGRSTVDSNTYRFKKQWGAVPEASVWQYYLRRGSIADMRPENSKYGLAIRAWRRLPVWLTRLLGPTIVRGIP